MRSKRWAAQLTRSRSSGHFETPRAPMLVIDDTDEAAAAVERIFASVEAFVLCAHTGADGIEMARTWQPGAILVNLALENMNAYDLARELRLLNRNEAFLVAMAGSPGGAREAGGQAGSFDAVTDRPVAAGKLAALVDQRRASETRRLKQIVVDGGHRLMELQSRGSGAGGGRTGPTSDSLETEFATLSAERLYLLDTLQRWEEVDIAEALLIGARSSRLIDDWSTRLQELEARL